MIVSELFVYQDLNDLILPDDSLSGMIPSGIIEKQQLLQKISDQLHFPSYFGFNWDALFECLRNLEWISEKNVFLVHHDVPSLPEKDLRNYLEILQDSVAFWSTDEKNRYQPRDEHYLFVVFPVHCRDTVEKILATPTSGLSSSAS